MITYGKQSISDTDRLAVMEALKDPYLTTGPKVKEFEEAFAKYCGAKYAVAVNSGTAALHIAYMAVDLKEGDEIVTTPLTFPATSNAALYCNATPVFADIKNDDSGLIDPEEIKNKVSPKTKIAVPMHYGGLPADLEEIKDIADKANAFIVEDACQAHGATYKDSKIGDCKYSDMCCFSFHPVKHMTTGEGGMVTTNNRQFYEKMLALRAHGMERNKDNFKVKDEGGWYFEMHCLGYNYRLTDFQCVLGLQQLKRLPKFVLQRSWFLAQKYDRAFKDFAGFKPSTKYFDRINSHHLYVGLVKDLETKKRLYQHLKEKGILCQVHHIPVHTHPYYQQLGFKNGDCPVCEDFYQRAISIPMHVELTSSEQDKVIEEIKGGLK